MKSSHKASPKKVISRGNTKRAANIEKEVKKAYLQFVESYLTSDYSKLKKLVDEHCWVTGTTEEEIFFSWAKALDYFRKTAGQVTGNVEFRNRDIRIKPVGSEALVTEQSDLYIKSDGVWIFYSRARVSVLFEKKADQWKIVHQHGSVPDMRTQEGETIALDKIKEENIALKDAVKRRTVELENKNRELEIEAAVERVRAKALAMHQSEEIIHVVNTMRDELDSLKLPGIGAATIILQQENGLRLWDITSVIEQEDGFHFSMDILFTLDGTKPDDWIRRVWDGTEKYFVIRQDSKGLKKTLAWTHKFNPEFAQNAQRFLTTNKVRNVWHPVVQLSHGRLSLDLFQEPVVETESILTKMGAAFDLAYKRFLDLQKAEAQAREAQIEAALEKVRSRSLAMHKSEEMGDVVNEVLIRLQELNVPLGSANILVYTEGSPDFNIWTAGVQAYHTRFVLPIKLTPHFKHIIKAIKTGQHIVTYTYDFKEKNKWFNYLFEQTGYSQIPKERRKILLKTPGLSISVGIINQVGIQLNRYSLEPFTESENNILVRFAKVFDQSYTRFLDLKKAEAQTREAQIEVAVERVRAKALAMHKSEEIISVVRSLRQELDGLQIPGVIATTIYIAQEDGRVRFWDLTTVEELNQGDHTMDKYLRLEECPDFLWFKRMFRSKEKYMMVDQEKEELKRSMEWISQNVSEEVAVSMINFFDENNAWHLWHPRVLLEHGVMNIDFIQPPPAEVEPILIKMGAAFDLAYKRFLDLQKAEAQAREAQIQLSLERVRARAMAMHHSDEISDVLSVLFEQFDVLGISPMYTFLSLIDLEKNTFLYRQTGRGGKRVIAEQVIHLDAMDVWNDVLERWKAANYDVVETMYVPKELVPEVFEVYKDIYAALPEGAKVYPEDFPDGIHATIAASRFGHLGYDHFRASTEEEKSILLRFNTEFVRLYQRFLDLQKAEAQAREAQIEAALEKIRSRSLAMHKSNELQEVIKVVMERLNELGIAMDSVNINIPSKDRKSVTAWVASQSHDYTQGFSVPWKIENTIQKELTEAYESGMDYFSKSYGKEAKDEYFRDLFEHSDFRHIPDERKAFILHAPAYGISSAGTQNSWIQAISYSGKTLSANEAEVLKRFARVFEQCYIRFQDLERAEKQARESQIEAALERVRSKAMAMHSSEDLAATVGIFYSQLETFNLTPRRCGVGLLNKSKNAELFTWNTTEAGQSLELIGNVILEGHPVLENIYTNWLSQTEYHPVLRGNDIKEYYQIIRPQMAFPDYDQDAVHYGYFFYFAEGGVYAWTEKELAEDELQIYRRFTSVLSLTYKRYKDLKEAEARSKEAVKQAALDRVRAEIASMRTTADLERITPLIWRELTTLGIPFVRCGVFIMDEEKQTIRTFLSTPDGRAIAAFELPYDSIANLAEAIHAWRQHQPYVTHWVEKDFDVQAESLVRQGAIPSREQYLKTIPKEGIHLHFAPFLQGMLYVGSTGQLSNDDLQSVQFVAEAFSTAYARYEDFNKLEVAKQQVDKALVELKQAQQQLVQAEKMASLGELTAGIAHEIQNPLNFVNNFSEVNKELISEMEVAIQEGDLKEAIAIANDISRNQEKINQHGKRAEGIVKGMLLHSRGSSGQRELTDMNALCDEYLKLSYHGYRAKDKSFNAKFETDFDSSLEKINVVPQDIGRVILNLINNAFYAVNEKAKQGIAGYEPIVTVSTHCSPLLRRGAGGEVKIRVKDNGPGIPQKVLDKIFQPFFTTKPTGQGTGLGLSLSYDIVKAHGGELKVETKEEEGSEFVIVLAV
jgi:signal transduction histidine kinase/ketosteroid isomerase-like protein